MIEDVKREQEYTNARLREYVDMMGGSYDGWMGYLERGLDAVTFGYGGAVITAGSHTRKKIAIELTDSAVTVLRDAFVGDKKGRMPVHVALVYEAVFQVADALTREGPKNESWDVVKSWPKDQGIRHTHGVVNATDERAMIEGMTAERVMETLKQLKPLVSDQLEGENFRDRLLRAHGGSALAAAFTESAVFRVRPDVEILERDLLGSPPEQWVITQFTTRSGMYKTNLKELVGTIVTGQDPSFAKSSFLDLIQAAVRDGLLEQIERERLEVWARYLEADASLQMRVAILRNESRVKRIDQRLLRVLADEVIPKLRQEIEDQKDERRFDVISDAGVTGREAELVLEFSSPVDVTSLKLADVDLRPRGRRDRWTAKIDLREFEAASAQLTVEADHPALEDRSLDNPLTIARWSSWEYAFQHYEQEPDTAHTIRLDPPEGVGYAVVLDTSGSMAENNRMPQAKAALARFFASGQIAEGEQIGVFTYSGCSVGTALDFTDDLELANTTIQGAGAYGSTPLASSIYVASQALVDQNFERGVLVVVTDGEDSCSGSVSDALSEARSRIDRLRRKVVR